MYYFGNPLKEYSDYDGLKRFMAQNDGAIELKGCIDASKAFLIQSLSEGRMKVIVTYSEQRANELVEEYKLYDKEVFNYPAKDILFYQADVRGNYLTEKRLSAIKKLAEDDNATIVTTIDALMDVLIPPEDFFRDEITICENDSIDIDILRKRLTALGYEYSYQVEKPGDFAIRGGIIDIFPISNETPVRIELFDTDIDSIKTFDVDSQRSIRAIKKLEIPPAEEVILSSERLLEGINRIEKDKKKAVDSFREQFKTEESYRIRTEVDEVVEALKNGQDMVRAGSFIRYFYDKTSTFLDYIEYFNRQKEQKPILFLDEPIRCIEKAKAVFDEYSQSMQNRLEKGYVLAGQADCLADIKSVTRRISDFKYVSMSTLDQKVEGLKPAASFNIISQAISAYNKNVELLIKDIGRYKKAGFRIVLFSGSESKAKRLAQDITSYGHDAVFVKEMDRDIKEGEIVCLHGRLKKGVEFPLLKFCMISESDLFGEEKKKKKLRKREGEYLRDFSELKIGDFVVHENHGLGIYRGIEKIEVDGITKDYLKVEYDKGGMLYVQVNNLDILQKYASADAKAPKINTLGSTEWTKTKTRVRNAVKDIAKELVTLYAKRESTNGYEFSPDTVWQKEFEEMFPFEETEGQILAIEATKRDMESKKAMDRLVCGDVGFGKTEVAIRAAFKAVQDGKQVAYLVPTTILAEQHYNTFSSRMKDTGVNIELLCRFRTPAEQKKTIEKLKNGQVDIVIGTHRLLSKDVSYKDLGLLIIDEEQRFGVTHKEKIKQLKNSIDVLTLTATPIPRTLHMSLVGIRDMSVLEEAPVDRMPIQTYVLEHNEEIIREAINRELSRNGQVYYVFNRVKQIQDVANRIQALVPDALVAFAHGQMKEQELENIMSQFINGDIDVLVSTTIIETGLDIPNVNTIIIDGAENMGLSQLYQLRGRVGRSNRTSYAFLMYRKDKLLEEVAQKRLAAIKEFTELGSGIKIALKDLEIRGAGNLLGADQSGHMEAVGYDLYCKLLKEAVIETKGEGEVIDYETTLDINVDAFIPSTYIQNEYQKLDMYKRIAGIETYEDREDILDELLDRFGEPDKCVNNLLDVAVFKARAHHMYITEIKEREDTITFKMYPKAAIKVEAISEFISSFEGACSFDMKSNPPAFVLMKKMNSNMKKIETMDWLGIFLDRFEEFLI